jgi:antitoxin component YwqK of YwqJK toxin-antitoxin module
LAVVSSSLHFKNFTSLRLSVSIAFLLLISSATKIFSQKKYHKKYYESGQIKEEGWILNDKKTAFWKFYYQNGNLKKEGHFKNNLETNYWYFYSKNSSKEKEGHFKKGSKNNWWLFYDMKGFINHKCQLKNNQKNGYCLIYKKQKLIKASKYKNGKKLKEWTDFSSFTNENDLNDL